MAVKQTGQPSFVEALMPKGAGANAALDRLEIKGLVKSKLGESTPERGGRAKRYFTVTAEGVRSIQATRRVLTGLWRSLPQ